MADPGVQLRTERPTSNSHRPHRPRRPSPPRSQTRRLPTAVPTWFRRIARRTSAMIMAYGMLCVMALPGRSTHDPQTRSLAALGFHAPTSRPTHLLVLRLPQCVNDSIRIVRSAKTQVVFRRQRASADRRTADFDTFLPVCKNDRWWQSHIGRLRCGDGSKRYPQNWLCR